MRITTAKVRRHVRVVFGPACRHYNFPRVLSCGLSIYWAPAPECSDKVKPLSLANAAGSGGVMSSSFPSLPVRCHWLECCSGHW